MNMRRTIKRVILALVIVFTTFSLSLSFAQEANEIKIIVDGSVLESDQPPIMVNDRVLVPLRSIFNALYADVEWIEETQTVIANKRLQTISLSIGSNEMYINGEAISLDSPAILVNGRTMVPVRAISESLGAKVWWDENNNTVVVSSSPQAHYISDHYIKETIKSDDGRYDLLNIIVSYPQIRNDENNAFIDQLNETLETDAQKSFESIKEVYVSIAKEIYNEVILQEPEMMYAALPFEMTERFDITYDDNDMISIVKLSTWWTGGAHPNSVKTSVTYDLQSGKELMLTDIFNKSQNEIYSMIIEEFTNLINQQPENYFEDSKDLLVEEIESVGFYLEENGITFYFNPYIIAPYVAGYPSLTLSVDRKYGFSDRFIDN